jgi:hypothetical protein|tara:strand:- start:153 stop:476 length:324 start_codon:yes stop_codon:yes gene_type:complete
MIKIDSLDNMVNGWFVGNFNPSILKNTDTEVAIKKYKKGDTESSHYHKIATEITVILDGSVSMNGQKYSDGDIVKINPGVSTNFEALTDVTTVVVKYPGTINDKYLC